MFFKNVKIEVACDPGIPYLGTHIKEMKSVSRRTLYLHVEGSIFHNNQSMSPLKCSLVDE